MKRLLLFLTIFLLGGVLYAQEIDHTNLTPPSGEALVYVLRPSLMGFAAKSDVFANDIPIGFTRGLTFIYTALPPGEYTFTSKYGKEPASFRFQANQTYYIKQELTTGLVTMKITHVQLDHREAMEILSTCNLSSGQKYVYKKDNISYVDTDIDKLKDNRPPLIEITSPQVNRGFDIVKTEPSMTVAGIARATSGIKEVLVNGIQARIDAQNMTFEATLPLEEGNNLVTVIAISNSGKSSTQSFEVKRDRRNSRDNIPPTISILSPKVSRGFDIVQAESSIKVLGKALDDSGIREVKINDKQATVYSDGSFTGMVALTKGSNAITVVAIDNNNQVATKTFQVQRKETTTTDNKPITNTNEKRVALVIGNSNYKSSASLGENPINDANDMAATLENLGFTVIKGIDTDRSQMSDAIRNFGRQSQDADVAMFYYAGHGMQSGNVNYLIPLDAEIKNESDIEFECISVNRVQSIMESSSTNRLNIMVLDACRNNPFRSWSRSSGGGLADMTPPSGTLIAFATSPGATASNGTGRNGLYTSELIKQLQVPQRIEDVFIKTRIEVEKKSAGQQSPWELARLRGIYYLKK